MQIFGNSECRIQNYELFEWCMLGYLISDED